MDTKFHRRSVRLPNFNYAESGTYFLTICTYNRISLFGKIVEGEMVLNAYGNVVSEEWQKTLKNRALTKDAWVILPNHFHAMVTIHNSADRDRLWVPEKFSRPVPKSIPTLVRSFKSAVTKGIRELDGNPSLPVWQRNYYEKIVRTEKAYCFIDRYIRENVAHHCRPKRMKTR